ncbi:hypothetical protein CEP51_009969 [Fusarium floridanum]|uniref:Uncharacterized protein n=1 Tax=Fusarium floridanum TaxID=1325733 RepID=A0A428RFW8_9HYPO|nr:hypothetical protein CEP51_009969 [Fusarium floridanum]
MSVLRPLRSFRRRIRRPTSPSVREVRPQVADEERRPSVIRRLFTRKKATAVEENLEPVVSEPVVPEPEVFNQTIDIGDSATGTSPRLSDLEEVQSNRTGEITPVVLRVQQRATGRDRPREETPAEAIPAEEPLAEELPIDRIPGE